MTRVAGVWLLTVLLAGPAWAARRPAAGLAPAGDLHGAFTQEKKVVGLPRALRSRGNFDLLRGRGLVWRTLAPLAGTVVLGPRGVWALQAGSPPRRLAAGGEALDLMSRLLSPDPAALSSSFTVVDLKPRSGFRYALTPKSALLAKVFRHIVVRGGRRVEQADLVEASGDRTRIRFNGVRVGAGALAPDEEALLAP